MKPILAAIFVSLALARSALAFDIKSFAHIPPEIDDTTKPIKISIPATDLARARILVGSSAGYQAVSLERRGDSFVGQIGFGASSVLNYQFQMETSQGRYFESGMYRLRQPTDPVLEGKINALKSAAEVISAKKSQLETVLVGLKNADPADLGKRKSDELARAYLLLGQRERELGEVSAQLKDVLTRMPQNPDATVAEKLSEAKKLLDGQPSAYLGNKPKDGADKGEVQ
jgi:hypothetical protein